MDNMPAYQVPYTRTKRVTLDCGEGLTEQSHKDQCDINVILRDYQRTGLIKHAKEFQGKYDDVTHQDFQEAMFIVADVNNMFRELPSQTRKLFNNSPQMFLEFAQNPENYGQMEQMGILKGNDGFDVSGAITKAPTERVEVPSTEQKGPTSDSALGGGTEPSAPPKDSTRD